LEAYCMKCKQKREIADPRPGFNRLGRAITTGHCPMCGTKMYRTGKTEAHAGMVAPKVVHTPSKKISPKNEKKRCGKLVIVESPAKAHTVGNFLGKEYQVRASIGHVRDLLRSQLSVDINNGFTPKYRIPNEKRKVVKELKKLASEVEEIFLATDPDREGEAIAWHLIEAAELEEERVKRVVFHEITKPAIAEAFTKPRGIDEDLVNAQQARRILDRLVGYNLTPLLWQKVRNRLSAGRVQSVALRLIIEREREIEAFIPQEYWTIDGEFRHQAARDSFIARLVRLNHADVNLPEKGKVDEILPDLRDAHYSVSKIKRGTRTRQAFPPFITSTLQQQASRQLGFTAKHTMAIAQQLYEGLTLGEEGEVGLITYMRTDSTQVSPLAISEAREYILSVYGKSFLPLQAIIHRTRSAHAQEAHEAIRPTSVLRTPEKVRDFLTGDQFKLYQLVWKRFIASQMTPAVYETLTIEIEGNGQKNTYLFRASGSQLKFPGFLILYEEAMDEDAKKENGELKIPELLQVKDELQLIKLIPEQHFTQPPPHFTEASLVQELEENGIGRPSTYATIISTIQTRGYVERDGKKLLPTDTGYVVNDLLVEYFPDVLGVNFTARMEKDLDEIAGGKKNWQDAMREFYQSFEPKLKYAQEKMPENVLEPEKIEKLCPLCRSNLVIKWGRFGKFISCSNYPTCKYTEPYLLRIGVACPKDQGELVERKSRKGRVFYGCENYPKCDFTSWKKPLNIPCPSCSGMLVIKNKNEAQCIDCSVTYQLNSLKAEESA